MRRSTMLFMAVVGGLIVGCDQPPQTAPEEAGVTDEVEALHLEQESQREPANGDTGGEEARETEDAGTVTDAVTKNGDAGSTDTGAESDAGGDTGEAAVEVSAREIANLLSTKRAGPQAARYLVNRAEARLVVTFRATNGKLKNGRVEDTWDVTCLRRYGWQVGLRYRCLDKPGFGELDRRSVRLRVNAPQVEERVHGWVKEVYGPARIPPEVNVEQSIRLVVTPRAFRKLIEKDIEMRLHPMEELARTNYLTIKQGKLEVQ